MSLKGSLGIAVVVGKMWCSWRASRHEHHIYSLTTAVPKEPFKDDKKAA